MSQTISTQSNPLGTQPIGRLLLTFSLPTVISMLVNSVYNMVDQIFIGWGVGTLGNSATNAVFPMILIATSVALLFGDGAATLMNLHLGKGDQIAAQKSVSQGITLLLLSAVAVLLVFQLFLHQLLNLFGATPDNLHFAVEYARIIVVGFPFMIITTGLSSMIRADGSPKLTMMILLSGAILNILLDALFVLGLHMGMTGAALATVIGQIVSFTIAVWYIPRFRTVRVTRADMRLSGDGTARMITVGISSTITTISIAIISTVGNNLMRWFGPMTVYGADITLAAFGIVMKVTSIFTSIMNGISIGCNPIFSFNYAAQSYDRVKETFRLATIWTTITAALCFVATQFFPEALTGIFGDQGELYKEFSVKSFRLFNAACLFNGFHTVTCMYFQAVGKPVQSIVNTLGRQVVVNLAVTLIFSFTFAGVWGSMYGAAVTDAICFVIALAFAIAEFRNLNLKRKGCAA